MRFCSDIAMMNRTTWLKKIEPAGTGEAGVCLWEAGLQSIIKQSKIYNLNNPNSPIFG